MKKTLLILLLSVTVIAGAVVMAWNPLLGRPVGEWLFATAIERQMASDITTGRDDGLLVGICGAGGPLANPVRTGPCVFIRAGDRIFVFDAGNNAARNLSLMQVPFSELEAVFLTHFHSDHIDGLGELMLQRWIVGRWTQPLPIYGPEGVEQVVAGFNLAYALDQDYRVRHHGRRVAPSVGAGGMARTIVLEGGGKGTVVYDRNNLRIAAFSVDHSPAEPALGYRVDYKGRSVTISGDTAFSEVLIANAEDVDLLLHEALQPRLVELIGDAAQRRGAAHIKKIADDIPSYHSSPEEAAKAAAAAGARHLLLYHIVPPLPTPLLNQAFLGDAADFYTGPITLAEEGTLFFLPVDTSSIIQEQ